MEKEGSHLPSAWNNPLPNTKYMNQWSLRQWISNNKEQSSMKGGEKTPMIATFSWIEKASRWWHRKDVTQEESKRLLELRRWMKIQGKVCWQDSVLQIRELHRERSSEIGSNPWLFHRGVESTWGVCEESTWDWGKNHSKS
jgi:hypothetical protein